MNGLDFGVCLNIVLRKNKLCVRLCKRMCWKCVLNARYDPYKLFYVCVNFCVK